MILVDTNVWFYHYWRIPLPKTLEARLTREADLAISPVSALEIGIRQRKGKLPGIRAARSSFTNASSVSLLPRPRMRDITSERLALVKTSGITLYRRNVAG